MPKKNPKKNGPFIKKDYRRLLACKIIEYNNPHYINDFLQDSSVGKDFEDNFVKNKDTIKTVGNLNKQFQTVYEEMRVDLFGENLSETEFLFYYTFQGKCCLSTYAEFKAKYNECYLSRTPPPKNYKPKADKIALSLDDHVEIKRNTQRKNVKSPFEKYESDLVFALRDMYRNCTAGGPTLNDLRYCLLKMLLDASDFKTIERECTPEYGGKKCNIKECITEGYVNGLCMRFDQCLDSGTLKRKKYGLIEEEEFLNFVARLTKAMDEYRLTNQSDIPTRQDDHLLNPSDHYVCGMI
jgi:hypothetical protein